MTIPTLAINTLPAPAQDFLGPRAAGGYLALASDPKTGAVSIGDLRDAISQSIENVPALVARSLVVAALKLDGGESSHYTLIETATGGKEADDENTMRRAEFEALPPARKMELARQGVRLI